MMASESLERQKASAQSRTSLNTESLGPLRIRTLHFGLKKSGYDVNKS